MKRAWKMAVALLLLCSVTRGIANAQAGYGVEGHVFSAETRRPLANAQVELWIFPPPAFGGVITISTEANEGGFYLFEFEPFALDEDGKDMAGYAFAYNCGGVIQIVPLYTRLHLDRVYQRDVYLNVPGNVSRCD